MNLPTFKLLLALFCAAVACSPTQKNESQLPMWNEEKIKDRISLSFAFIGCNRIAYKDRANSNDSKANVPALKRIFEELIAMEKKPDMLFFLGDLVLAEQDTNSLNTQLAAWVAQYNDPGFSAIAASGIELIAIPGNHEMLYYDDQTKGEYPLSGATEIWLKHMSPYMPKDRAKVAYDTLINGATFSFVRGSVAFVVMNTDTYNEPVPGTQFGREGQVPADWINQQIVQYEKSEAVRHVFALGHRPYYVDNAYDTLHGGFPDGPKVWPTMLQNKVVAMLTAHQHKYQRWQPEGQGTYEIIAGHGGTYSGVDSPQFYGYSLINVYESGKIKLITKGYDLPDPTWSAAPQNPTTVRDTTILTWKANANPYPNQKE